MVISLVDFIEGFVVANIVGGLVASTIIAIYSYIGRENPYLSLYAKKLSIDNTASIPYLGQGPLCSCRDSFFCSYVRQVKDENTIELFVTLCPPSCLRVRLFIMSLNLLLGMYFLYKDYMYAIETTEQQASYFRKTGVEVNERYRDYFAREERVL